MTTPAAPQRRAALASEDPGAFERKHPAGWVWRHVRGAQADAFFGAFKKAGAGSTLAELLSEEDVRAFCGGDHDGEGVALILRGINFDPNREPEDAIALRIYVSDRAITTASLKRVRAVERTGRMAFDAFASPFDVLLALTDELNEGWREAARECEAMVGVLEDSAISETGVDLGALQVLRRRVIGFTRHVGPYADMLDRLADRERGHLDETRLERARALAHAARRVVDVLAAVRDHAGAVQALADSIAAERARVASHRLAVVAAIFLPLNLVAAVMGANVGGVPGSSWPWGFIALSAILAGLGVATWAAMRRFD